MHSFNSTSPSLQLIMKVLLIRLTIAHTPGTAPNWQVMLVLSAPEPTILTRLQTSQVARLDQSSLSPAADATYGTILLALVVYNVVADAGFLICPKPHHFKHPQV